MSAIVGALRQIDWGGMVGAAPLQSLLNVTRDEITRAQVRALGLDSRLDNLRLLVRSVSGGYSSFRSPSAIMDGGVVREIAGVITLPESQRTDATRSADGSLRATLSLLRSVGSVTTTGNPLDALDRDTSSAWQIDLTTPIPCMTIIDGVGEIGGAYLTLEVRFDTPQFVSQLELGILGDPVQVLRVEDGETGELLFSGSQLADPGALIFLSERRYTQSIRIGLLQQNDLFTGRHYHYRVTLHTLQLLDVLYEAKSDVLLPSVAITSSLLRPLVIGEGNIALSIQVGNEWLEADSSMTLPIAELTEEMPLSPDGLIFLGHIPEEIEWVVLRKQNGQTLELSPAQYVQSGNSLALKGITGSGQVIVLYRYRLEQIAARLHLTRTNISWQSPTVAEVKLT